MIYFERCLHFFAAVTLAFILLFIGRGWSDWLRLVVTPQGGISFARAVAAVAQCRHRLSFKGGLFVSAIPA